VCGSYGAAWIPIWAKYLKNMADYFRNGEYGTGFFRWEMKFVSTGMTAN
jgi:hypothetical protein